MWIKVVNLTDLPVPAYAKPGDSGLDLRSASECTIPAFGWAIVPTGIKIELEPGYEAQVRPRSGLAASYGVFANFGTIDNSYRGEVKVIMINPTANDFTIHRGDRIAQLVPVRVEYATIEQVEALTDSERGQAGLGSTGVQ